jgi:leader peptidase (prepilin peptidase)/N-methyltransferase
MLDAALALLAGLLIGSFLNVCIYRMPREMSVIAPRSFCPSCGDPVAWYDNIPIASYVILGGRCRRCTKRIPWRYPLVEAITAVLFFAIVLVTGPKMQALKLCVFAALIVGLMFSDLEERDLPDQFTIGGTALGVLFAAISPFQFTFASFFLPHWSARWLSVSEAVVGAVLPAGLLWGLGALYLKIRHKEGLGLGDVKMVAMIGAFLGLQGAVAAVLVGSLLGSVIGMAYIWLSRKDPGSYELPFGTFLGAGAMAVALLSLR